MNLPRDAMSARPSLGILAVSLLLVVQLALIIEECGPIDVSCVVVRP